MLRDYFLNRRQHLERCWEHAQHHWVIGVFLFFVLLYGLYTDYGPFVELPEFHLKKLPLPWALVIVCVGLFFIVLEGGYRLQRAEKERWSKELEAVKEKLNDVPNIDVLQHGFYVDSRPLVEQVGSVYRTIANLSCLHVKFKNDPKQATPNSVARNIRAELEFFDSAGNALCRFQGRWGDTIQPPYLPQGQSPAQVLVTANFEIGQDRELDIAFKYPDETDCFGMSNETYAYRDWRHPQQKIAARNIRVRVRLRGVGVDSSWDFWFDNPQFGDLKRAKYLSVRKSD
jgi:hypothetical protein